MPGLRGTPAVTMHDVGALDVGVGVGALDGAVEAFDRARLREIERLALRHAFDDVEQHDVAEFLEADEMGERAADHAGADQGDLGARHGDCSPAGMCWAEIAFGRPTGVERRRAASRFARANRAAVLARPKCRTCSSLMRRVRRWLDQDVERGPAGVLGRLGSRRPMTVARAGRRSAVACARQVGLRRASRSGARRCARTGSAPSPAG